MRPRLARDHDIFFAAVALLCGGILFFQGWRQDPILQFGQFLLTASAVFFAVESIRLRGITTEQAKRNSPVEDFDRPVSRVYSAEFDDALNPYEERPARRRIQGSRDARPERDEYDEMSDDRRSARRELTDRSSERRRRRSRPESDLGNAPDSRSEDIYRTDDRPSRTRGTSSRSGNQAPGSPRARRSRSGEDESSRSRSRLEDTSSSEYVDYRPIDQDDDKWNEY
jgi:hypothetical protein